jgi:protein O-mannosyl-transferase
LAVLVIAASASVTANDRFVQDDLPLVLRNERVHTLAAPAGFFTQAYWHDPFSPALYRPLATMTLAVEWVAGDGSPAVFRWVSVAMLVGGAVSLFLLARLILPAPAAWAAAALFAVHPVHVEAIAPAVNQGELSVGLLACLATLLYIRERRRDTLRGGVMAALVILYAAAALFKENALVIPGLLLAAEGTVLRDGRPPAGGWAGLRLLYLLLVLAGVAVLGAGGAVLGGQALRTPQAEVLAGSSLPGRALTMLAVVPQWLRLLFWPARLQADYGPNEISAATGWGIDQWAGAAVLVVWLGLAVGFRRRLPVLSFGLLWMAVAILPVSNVLMPTGVALAERTLYLASIGAALAIGGLLAVAATRATRAVATAAVAALLILGVVRSGTRARVWRDEETLLRQTVRDAPRSYAAHLALSRFLDDSGDQPAAFAQYREAAELKPTLPDEERRMADEYRLQGLCRPAVRRYRRLLSLRPEDTGLRAALDECLLRLRGGR